MSRSVEALVWERSRAKGSNLLVLLKIADWAHDDGRDAFPGSAALARAARLSERAVRYILHRMEEDGEIEIELNVEHRTITVGKRTLCPEWFIHVRCVCDWEAYQQQSEKFSSCAFPAGRRRHADQPEKISGSADQEIGKRLPANRKNHVKQSEKFSRKPENFSLAYKEEIRSETQEQIHKQETQEPEPPPPPRKRPRFSGERICVFDWQHDKLQKILGAHAAAFDLDTWYRALDARAVQSPHVIPSRDGGAWLEAQLLAEAAARGLPMADAKPPRPFTAEELRDARRVRANWFGCCKHDPTCDTAAQCEGEIIRQWRRDRGEAA